jgi:hypothetical protein
MAKPLYQIVHYRRLQRIDTIGTSPTLEQMCRNALSAHNANSVSLWERAEDRVFTYPQPEDRKILLNRVADLQSAVFGEMCLMQAKDLQALIELKAKKVQLSKITTAEIYALSEKSAPHGSQFLRGLLYWLAIDDHLFFVKLNSISSANMQDYFDWLLTLSSSGRPSGMEINFQAEFDPSVVKGDVGEIRNLRIKGNAMPQVKVDVLGEIEKQSIVKTSRQVAEKVLHSTVALPIIEALLGKSKTESLVKCLGPEEYLAVDAAVKIRGKRTAESRAKIREIATEVADMTDAEVRIDGKDGTLRDGDAILRVRMPFSVPQDGSSLLEFDNVSDQLQEVYRRFVKDGKITA